MAGGGNLWLMVGNVVLGGPVNSEWGPGGGWGQLGDVGGCHGLGFWL